MFQIYVKGSIEAVELYQKAFDAKIVSEYKNENGSYMHAELDVFGQIVALAEALPEAGDRIAGTTMQLCLHIDKDKEESIKKAYELLKENAGLRTLMMEN
jgi:PhnB protein